MTKDTPTSASGQEEDWGKSRETTGEELWTVNAGGFSAAVDAFAIEPPEQTQDQSNIWFLSMVGPQISLKAISASLLNMPPKPTHLTPGPEGLTLSDGILNCRVPPQTIGTWTTRITRMANRMGYHAMVYTKTAEYSFDRDDFLLVTRTGENQTEQHHRFLDRRISLPLHHSWAGWLWERGLKKGEIQPLECLSVRAWKCVPDPEELEADLGVAIAARILTLPESPKPRNPAEEEGNKDG